MLLRVELLSYLLYGQGLLNVGKPIADVEGVDLMVKKGCFHPLLYSSEKSLQSPW